MIIRALISAIVMFALTMVGFGHRPLTPAADAQATAYALAGGSWTDICGQDGDPRHTTTPACQACIIAHSCLLAAPQIAPISTQIRITWDIPPVRSHARLTAFSWAYPARAPPFT